MAIEVGPEPRFGRAVPRVVIMGAGSGVGLACARALAASGANLLLSDIDGASLRRVTREIGGRGLFCDVASEASVAVFAAEVRNSFSSLDVLINAAGRSYVRTLGTLRISRALLPTLKQDGRRKDIVNIADMEAGPEPSPFPYAASLKAFASLADALTENVRGTSVVLTTIMPRIVPGNEDDFDYDAFAPMSVAYPPRRFHCDLADSGAFAERLAAAVHSPDGDWRRHCAPPAVRMGARGAC